jgi:hypothetical protein
LPNAKEPETSSLQELERMMLPSNGSSMRKQKLSETSNGRLTVSVLQTITKMPSATKLSVPVTSAQDGGRSSDSKGINSSTFRTEKFSTSVVEKMLKVRKLVSGVTIMEPTKNGKYCILTKQQLQPQVLQRPQDSESMFHSSLCQDSQ